jgi:hypothetical protein
LNLIKNSNPTSPYNCDLLDHLYVGLKPQEYKSSSTLIRHEKQGTSEAIDIVQPDNGMVNKNNPVFPK